MADHGKLTAEDEKLKGQIKDLKSAPDYHTVENRDKRKALQERRNTIAKGLQILGENSRQAQAALQSLYQSIETNLALADHAETREWKEVAAVPGVILFYCVALSSSSSR